MVVRAEGRGAVMRTKWAMALLLAVVLVFMTTGCGEEENTSAPGVADFEADRQALADRKKPGNKAKKKKKKKSKAAKIAGQTGYAVGEQDYFYDPRGKRDPFRSIRFADKGPEKKDFGPLGDFELGQLERQAVIWDANNPRALILDPGGRSYIVREGAAIGKNNGQVIHIGDNLVLVKETYENFAGERTTKDVELRIRLSQGG
jgi:type IV pilus assembly protein PilP